MVISYWWWSLAVWNPVLLWLLFLVAMVICGCVGGDERVWSDMASASCWATSVV